LATVLYSTSSDIFTGTKATGCGVPSGKHGCADQESGIKTPWIKDKRNFRSITIEPLKCSDVEL